MGRIENPLQGIGSTTIIPSFPTRLGEENDPDNGKQSQIWPFPWNSFEQFYKIVKKNLNINYNDTK